MFSFVLLPMLLFCSWNSRRQWMEGILGAVEKGRAYLRLTRATASPLAQHDDNDFMNDIEEMMIGFL
jgi:hypothetical protein